MTIDKNYRIVFEENNTILQYYQERTKTKKDNSKEVYEFTDNFYYPNLKTCLKAYLNKSISVPGDISKVIERINIVEKKISKLTLKLN
tara:strand:- start:651 stop:914 length:264 start_codon:yes stop_codon:yes gene_type:complete